MSDRPTPETDVVLATCSQSTGNIDFSDFAVMHQHACKLERQRDAYAETLRELESQRTLWLTVFIRERHPELAP